MLQYGIFYHIRFNNKLIKNVMYQLKQTAREQTFAVLFFFMFTFDDIFYVTKTTIIIIIKPSLRKTNIKPSGIEYSSFNCFIVQ